MTDLWTAFGDVAAFRTAPLKQSLGRGTFKKVVAIELNGAEFARAEYAPQKRWVADDYDGRTRFCREVRAMRELSSSNVMPVICAELTGERPWFVMPLADENLEGMAEHVTTRAEAVAVLMQVVDGLTAMHARGFIHRDLKPNNVFRVGGRWVIGDLGFLRDFGAESTTQADLTLLGSHRAPEVRMSLRNATEASDVFSMGWIVQNVVPMVERKLTGRAVPFRAMERAPRLRAVVERCLQEEEGARYQSAEALRAELVGALDDWARTIAKR